MSGPTADDDDSATVPALPQGVRLHFHSARDVWVLLGPERVIVLDSVGYDVFTLIDGHRTLASIVDALAARYDAPRAAIAADVRHFLARLVEKQMVTL